MRVVLFILCNLLCNATVFAAEFRVGVGLVDHQVFQRNAQNTTDIKIGGTADGLSGKQIEARILDGSKILKGWSWKPVAKVDSATWIGSLASVPTGGPYDIEFRSPGATPVVVKDILVGDLWLLAGQSNMEGVGDLVDVQPSDPRVHSFDQLDRWLVAKEPLHNLPGAVDRVHWRGNSRLTGPALERFNAERKKGAGLGLPFAVEMTKRTRVPIGLIPCAHGGASMAQWDPALKDRGGDSLYGATIRRFHGAGGKVAGVLWYQGEAEAGLTVEPLFSNRFEQLVASFRKDFSEPDLPFYYVQLGRHISNANVREWNAIQERQRVMEPKLGKSGVVAAVDLPLDDGIHIGTPGLKRLGIRLANVATAKARSPNVAAAQLQGSTIRVKFTNVTGKLRSEGRSSGFSIHTKSGEVPAIYRVDLDGDTAVLQLVGKLPVDAVLHYGFGKDPYCNVRDDADMAVLVFGPLPIQQ
ncbi:MAG TPA: sialate O-acetylesterase [Bryobacteraceae bacterium]|nr:sialate O-acetylesterase [Bryobacteraceae bacterium]